MQHHSEERNQAQVLHLQKAAFHYFIEFAHPRNGLIADTSQPTSPCSIATVGFALSCYPVGVENGWISREDASQRTLTVLRFFAESAQGNKGQTTGYRGFYYHFLDMENGLRTWKSEVSTIDTALLIAGMLTAAAYFTAENDAECAIRTLAQQLYERVDWRWALNNHDRITHGWKPPGRFLRWDWQGYSEALILYILALASPTHPVPRSAYDAFVSYYTWMTFNDQPYLYAGPLFIHQYSHAWIDFCDIQDEPMRHHHWDYVRNTQSAIAMQRDYAARNPGCFVGYDSDIWGLSASDGPSRQQKMHNNRARCTLGYAARGVPFGPDDGTIAPISALSTLPYAPEAALRGTSALLDRYPALLTNGRFPGGFNPSVKTGQPEGWIDDRCVGLDQGLLVMMAENARTGLIWRLMRSSPILRLGLERAGFRGGWLDQV